MADNVRATIDQLLREHGGDVCDALVAAASHIAATDVAVPGIQRAARIATKQAERSKEDAQQARTELHRAHAARGRALKARDRALEDLALARAPNANLTAEAAVAAAPPRPPRPPKPPKQQSPTPPRPAPPSPASPGRSEVPMVIARPMVVVMPLVGSGPALLAQQIPLPTQTPPAPSEPPPQPAEARAPEDEMMDLD
jgi:hypothetical protein